MGKSMRKTPCFGKVFFCAVLSLLSSTELENIFCRKKLETCLRNPRDFVTSFGACLATVLCIVVVTSSFIYHSKIIDIIL
jgi:hypothetical protein